MLIAERFLNSSINKYGKYNISTDGGVLGIHPPQACKFLKLKHHHIHSSFGKSSLSVQSNT